MIATNQSPLKNSTLSRLLDGAERSIFRHGYKGSSIRRIAQEAGTNIASINYHFGSKKELFAAIIQRRLSVVTQQRCESLRHIEGRDGYSIDDVVRAYFGELFEIRQSVGQEVVVVIWTLLTGDPEMSQFSLWPVGESYINVRQRYAQAFAAVAPDLSVGELEWRLEILERFALCAMAGPNTFWTLRAIGSDDAVANQLRDSLSDGLISIIRACIQAPPVMSGEHRMVGHRSAIPGE